VKRLYATGGIVSTERIVFDIKGNAYRLVIAADFEKRIVWIKWLGTNKDYDLRFEKSSPLGSSALPLLLIGSAALVRRRSRR